MFIHDPTYFSLREIVMDRSNTVGRFSRPLYSKT